MKSKKALFFIIPAIVVIIALAAFLCYELFIVKKGWVKTAVQPVCLQVKN